LFTESVQQLINFRLHFHQMAFQRKIRFWSKIYNNWKVTLLPFS